MKRSFIAAASLIIIMAACNNNKNGVANTASDTSANVANRNPEEAPVIRFEETTYDFGKIKTGEKVTHEFKFKNVGKSPLIILDAQTTCGCTVPEKPKDPVAPGDEGVIKVVFNSEGKFGQQHKVITLMTNAYPATSELSLVGEVEEENQTTNK